MKRPSNPSMRSLSPNLENFKRRFCISLKTGGIRELWWLTTRNGRRERIAIDRGRFRALRGFSVTTRIGATEYVSSYVRASGRPQNHLDLLGFSRIFRIQERPGDARPASLCLPRGSKVRQETLVVIVSRQTNPLTARGRPENKGLRETLL